MSEMRACPYCAEDIRAAATVCRFCQRDVGPGAVAIVRRGGSAPVATGVRRSRRWGWLGLAAVAAGAVILTMQRAERGAGPVGSAAAMTVAPPSPPPPVVQPIANEAALTIPAGRAYSWAFEVRDRRACRLTGHLAGLAGGRKDVKVFLMTADQYTNWAQGLKVEPAWRGGQVAALTLDATLPGPGAYRLVLDNTFSAVTEKVVQVEDARVTCG